MSPPVAVFVMMNNYFHDVATAMPVACALTMRLFMSRSGNALDASSRQILERLHRSIGRIVRFSWVWIAVSGAIRIATVGSYEWPLALQKGQTYGLAAKYALAVFMMALGAFIWAGTGRKMRRMSARPGA